MFAADRWPGVPMQESGGPVLMVMQELPAPTPEPASAAATPAATDAATPVVSAFYDRFPYPGDPLQDGPPPGYNWRWCIDSVVAAVRVCCLLARRGVDPGPGGCLMRAVAPA